MHKFNKIAIAVLLYWWLAGLALWLSEHVSHTNWQIRERFS